MKHILRYIFSINLIFFSNSNINSCVSFNYEPDWYPYEKIFLNNLEDQTRRTANKFIQSTGFDCYTIPTQLLPEYEQKIKDAIDSLKKLINSNWDNFVYLSNVENAVQTYLVDFKKKLTKIVLSHNIEHKVISIIQKIAHKKEINLNQIPYDMIPEYNDIKYSIVLKLRQKMEVDNRNYVRTNEIKQVVHKEMDPFFDKVKNRNNSPWNNIATSLINTIFNPQPSTPLEPVNYLNETCSICKNKFITGDRVSVLSCTDKHFFHEGCIKQWFTYQKCCPICQKTLGANGKDLIIAQIETVSYTPPIRPSANPQIIQSYELDTKILELSNRILSEKGISTNNLPARVVSDFNDAIKKIKERLYTVMSLENRTYITTTEAETIAKEELKPVIDKIKYVGETCSICLENFRAGDKVGILNCNGGHFFHKDCIYPWLNADERKSCPLCRQENVIVSQIQDVPFN